MRIREFGVETWMNRWKTRCRFNLRYAADLPSETLCVRLVEERGVMFTPGSAMDVEGYLRIGYASHPGVLAAGLAEASAFLAALAATGR